MKRTFWIVLCSIILGCSCTSSDEKHLEILINELGIEFVNQSDSNYVIVIPGNGCGSCIQSAINEMHESEDTAYVFICDSPKEFYLQSGGKQVSSFRNLYLDKDKVAFRLKMVQTYPMAFLYRNRELLMKSPYKSKRGFETKKETTTVTFDKICIDLGEIKYGHSYKDSIRIINMGKIPLYIKNVHSSCDCTEAELLRKIIPPSESEVLHVTFRPDAIGEFERLIFINCNVNELFLEIPIKGIIY